MRNPGQMPAIAVAIIASMSIALAQSPGTAPQNMGQDNGNADQVGGSSGQPSQTGKSGQSKPGETTGQSTASAAQAARDAESAKTQPLMAEGIDLKGTPRRFPAAKTPE